jgi:glycosyltransferase involved in cell wall biosynthesis
MKVLILGPPLNTIGGIQNYLKIFIYKLKKEEYNVHYFSQSFKPKNGLLFYFYFFIQYIKFIIKIRTIKPDIIQFNPSLIWASIIRDFLFLNISKMNYSLTIFFIRGWRWQFFNRIKKNPLLRKLFISNLKKVDKILVLSKDFKQALVELGIDETTIHITSTMVESHLFLPENKAFYKPYKVLYCGHMVKLKGPYELLDAVPKVLEHETNLSFVFMGDGPELENLKSKTKEMGIEKYVSFTGYKSGEEKYDIFKSSHIFVLPSYTEGFPNVVLEAMAAGLPIIATPVGGLKYAIRNGKNGFLIESNPPNPDDISSMTLKLLNDPNMMRQMSEFNIKEAENKYDVKVVTKEIEKIYLEIDKKKHK